MTFGITPVPSTGIPAEPDNGYPQTSFEITAVDVTLPDGTTAPMFIEWQLGGYGLGDADVTTVNFVFPLIATRGVGERANVITVHIAKPVLMDDEMGVGVPALIEGTLVSPPGLFYTSILYPLFEQEAMSVSVAALESGLEMRIVNDAQQVGVPSLQSGTLVATISFVTYDGRPFPDTSQVAVPSLQSGTLVVTISYLVYDARPFPDTSQVAVPSLRSGTLVVTINYVVYTNGELVPDTSQVFVPALISGTLV